MADAGSEARADIGVDAGVPDRPPPSDCLEGYSCVDGTCTPEEPCDAEADDCSRGTCVEGRCVNAKRCADHEDCRPNFRCSDGECVYEACSDTSCDRGVCHPRTGSCVNADECSGDSDCVEGYTCHEGRCREKDGFCGTVDCERGVCHPTKSACVNAEDCTDDSECVRGRYCTPEGNCELNECFPDARNCDRGVCDPSDRSCMNAESCSRLSDCLPNHSCVDHVCVPNDELCGKEGCAGNQICKYDEEKLTAACEESPTEPCRNSIDCLEDRVCRHGSCEEPGSCSSDDAEPNDDTDGATSYFDNRRDGSVSGTICSADADFFAFDTDRDEDFRGEFAVRLEYVPNDVGIADLRVRVLKPDGSEWFAQRVEGDDGEALITRRFSAAAPRGVYHVIVEDPGEVRAPGVRYRMVVDIVGQRTVDACKQVETLNTPTQKGNTLNGDSVELDASCVKNGDETPEDVYEFTIDRESYVEIKVRPDTDADLSAAIRSDCKMAATEVACTNTGRDGAAESVETTLEPGTYHLIVQGTGEDSGGKYTVEFNRSDASCTDADNHCISLGTAKICTADGQTLETVHCDLGCNERRNRCRRPKGDICENAVDASGGLSDHTVNFDRFWNDFSSAGVSCLADNSKADGPDKVFEVRIPDGEVLLADLELSPGVDGSMYVMTQCEDAATFCETGVVGTGQTTESLEYRNQSGRSQQVFLVVDSASGTSGTATLDVSVEELICRPGVKRCGGSDVEQCNSSGTGWNTIEVCSFGCKKARCRADVCFSALDVTGGGSWTFSPRNYADDYRLKPSQTSCFTEHSILTTFEGPDLVFRADVRDGKILEGQLTEPSGSSFDGVVYLVTKCADTATHESTCRHGSNDTFPGTETAAVLNDTGSIKTYYIVVDTLYMGSTPTDWTLDVTVQQPSCTPLETRCGSSSSSTLEYCSRLGLKYKSYTCQGSPSNCTSSGSRARCEDPTGDYCQDPLEYAGSSVTNKSFDMSNHSNQIETMHSCPGRATKGRDLVYRLAANAGETIHASAAAPSGSYDDPVIYVMRENCLKETSACVAGADTAFSTTESLSYTIPSGESGVYYVVFDSSKPGTSQSTWDMSLDVK